jgi:hypothetical protein
MRQLAPAVQGDQHSPQTVTWDGQNLTGAVLTAVKQNVATGDITEVTGTLTITDAENGIFTWAYSAADTGTAGWFRVQFRATYGDKPDSTMRTFWYVEPLLEADAVAAPAIVGVTQSQRNALDAANDPAGDNPVATIADIVTGSGVPEPATDGLFARLRAGVSTSWQAATSVGAALWAAVDEAAARTAIGAVADDDSRLTDAREWTADIVPEAEAQAGTATTRRAWTAQRVAQAIAALVSVAWTELTGTLTLAELNTAVSDATLDDSSATRTPTAHAASHATAGGDAIAPGDIGAATAADLTAHTGDTSNPHSVTAAQAGAAALRPAQVAIAGTTHTFALSDEGAIVVSQSGSPPRLRLPWIRLPISQ